MSCLRWSESELFIVLLIENVERMGSFAPLLNFLLLSLIADIKVFFTAEIRQISVPRWIQNNTEDSVVLDCDYTYNEKDLQLVLRWFFDDNPEPVYQWIPELNSRYTSEFFENRLDHEFSVNTVDAYSRFRALKIRKPTTELSGKYACLVTSLSGQDYREQYMFVYVPAKAFELSYTELRDRSINISCDALGLFPIPDLKLYMRSYIGGAPQILTDVTSRILSRPSGTYNAHLHRTFSANELTTNSPSVFECLLELPSTNYAKMMRIVYYPGTQWNEIDAPHGLSSCVCGTCIVTNTVTVSLLLTLFLCIQHVMCGRTLKT